MLNLGYTVRFGKALFQKHFASPFSLRFRLSAFFTGVLLIVWVVAALMSARACIEYVNEFFDTQQLLFAKRLAVSDLTTLTSNLPETKKVLISVDDDARGEEEDEALRFAVFTIDGQFVLGDGKEGDRFIFEPDARGFVKGRMHGDSDDWRILWFPSTDGRYLIAVAQEEDYRLDMAWDMLASQMLPWLIVVPVLIGSLLWLLTRELAPLRRVGYDLEHRAPRDISPLETTGFPSEVLPIADALNGLFVRTAKMLARERMFIADASHELRTPLAGLRVQAEVIALADNDEVARSHAQRQLVAGIDRTSRLVEQLLALSRLEAFHDAESLEGGAAPVLVYGPLDWSTVVNEVKEDYEGAFKDKVIELETEALSPPAMEGYPTLISLMVRNLVDNAFRYTPSGGHVKILIANGRFLIENTGPGVSKEHLDKLTERFFRPPGQSQTGSGLGLAIVKRIVELHNFELRISNAVFKTGGSGLSVSVWFRL